MCGFEFFLVVVVSFCFVVGVEVFDYCFFMFLVESCFEEFFGSFY